MGSIPARTGEPALESVGWPGVRVYPRAYGGTVIEQLDPPVMPGLSPRVRGNRVAPVGGVSLSGSIPARTGEPGWRGRALGASTVYPRAYGGTRARNAAPHTTAGLSPRVRGNLHRVEALTHMKRSIPARTGEPRLPVALATATEGSIPARTGEPLCGSCVSECPASLGRSIPARTGEPIYALPIPGMPMFSGLSPRVRGNQIMTPTSAMGWTGSIPARTGEPAHNVGNKVYPRAYGEPDALPIGLMRLGSIPARTGEPSTRRRAVGSSKDAGLSPRVRGNQ